MGGTDAGGASRVRLSRRLFQIAILTLTTVAGYRLASGRSVDGVEVFCPFGGIESAYSLLGGGRFACSTGAGNLAMLLSLLVLTLLARKAFCSWVCPVGTVAEGLARLGRLGRARFRHGGWSRSWDRQLLGIWIPGPREDRLLRWLRLPILIVILFFTYRTAELVFRPFDPYYVLFSFHGHDVRGYSYAILAGVLLLAVAIPMAWCRYLCPLGGLLWPFSRLGACRIGRDPDACTGCRACDLACPHSIEVSRSTRVDSGECTLCLECAEACPRATALTLTAPGIARAGFGRLVPAADAEGREAGAVTRPLPSARSGRQRVSRLLPAWTVPVLVATLALAGTGGARWIRIPSAAREFPAGFETGTGSNTSISLVRMKIEGVRCVDTAESALGQLEDAPGVLRAIAYAGRHEVEITFDGTRTEVRALIDAFEAPIWEPVTRSYLFHRFRVLEVDGEPLAP